MFYMLLLVTLITATLVSFLAAKLFSQPITNILDRIIDDATAQAWVKYLKFAGRIKRKEQPNAKQRRSGQGGRSGGRYRICVGRPAQHSQ